MNPGADSLLRPRPSGLAPYVTASVLAHLALVALGLVASAFLAGPRVNLEQTPIKASLVRLGVKREETLLPRKEEEPPPPAAEPTAVKLPSTDPVPVKPVTAPKPPAPRDARKSLLDAFQRTASSPTAAEGAADGDPAGDSALQEGEKYFGLLKSVVQRRYDVSDTIPEAERRALQATVQLFIGPAGDLIDARLTRPSGNALFDEAVLQAVQKARPFTAPPEHLRTELKRQGVAIVFRALN
jgi:TonB family protein